jgi:mRNA interferase MazF
MDRGEIWLAKVGDKSRPVVVLTRPEVIDVRELVTVAEITTTIRGLAVEVEVDPDSSGISRTSAVNCDGLHTLPRTRLTRRVGSLDEATLAQVCTAVGYALGC